ncbi:alpha-2-macroglobulin-like [Rhinoderma darwinii]|uniref:alpha-2-macroglobulin-like n=1 Tax=Rhinoderma darwinii TaxID=43563 RepID=UPI003F67F01A
MYLKEQILSLTLLCFIAGGRSEPQYAFSIPVLLRSGEMVRGCLEVKRHSEEVYIDIILDVGGENHTIFSELVPAENTFMCMELQAIYKYSEQCYNSKFLIPIYHNGYHFTTHFFSRSGSFVQIERPQEKLQCGKTYTLTVKYIFSQSGLQEGETTANFTYMILSRTKIVGFGENPVDLTNALQGEFYIQLEISVEYVPVIDVVVYYMLKKEVVTDTIRLNTETCFKNQVSSKFSKGSGMPGSTVNLEITADPRSLCTVRVYDSSIPGLHQDQHFTPVMVYSTLQYNSLYGYNIAGYYLAPPDPPCIDIDKQILIDGFFYSLLDFQNEGDAGKLFRNVGLNVLTNTTLSKPNLCGQYYYFFDDSNYWRGGFTPVIGYIPWIQSGQTHFQEIWFYNHITIPDSGSVSLPLQVPGTSTKWSSDVVCLSYESGFGMTEYPANFTSFQEFFLDVYLPNSFIQGETIIVRAVVSNYLGRCAMVSTTLEPSDDYTVEPVDEEIVKCICSRERASFSFKLGAKSLGVVAVTVTSEIVQIGNSCEGVADPNQPPHKDTVVKSVTVEPVGIHNEETKSIFVCVKDTKSVIPISIFPPENSVRNSVKAKVTVIGDILGRALVIPESLIQEPTGSGEQNLATLTAIVLVVEYLTITGRLTEETKSRAVKYMGIGYRNQLRLNNNYGTFGLGFANSWLTLFTLATFQRITPYTYVDDRVFNRDLAYLEGLKNANTGAFIPRGSMFNNALQDGDEDYVIFTALSTVFFFQTTSSSSLTLLRDPLKFLDAASRTEQSIYKVALLFYVFRVAGNKERSTAMFGQLKELAFEEDGTIHWERPDKPSTPTTCLFPPRAASAEIEITAYVLLALTSGPSPPLADLSYLSRIALWLSQQQSAFGSYSTTSDTVVALQALCSYGILVYQKDSSNVVEVKYGDEAVKEFNLDSGNRDLLQSQPLPNLPGDYSMTVSGNGCVLLQTTVDFNIPVNEENSVFLLSVHTPSESCVNGVAHSFPVHINVSYNGLHNQSNMALIDLELPSGYIVESQYLMQVSTDEIFLFLWLQMNTRVLDLQPTYVLISDYYEKGKLSRIMEKCSKI